MNRLQLATLLSWAGAEGIKGRKRLQKVVYFLQEAGCPLDCRYILHHYGPYSRDVADRCDEMVAASLIEEGGGPASGDMQYVYALKPETKKALNEAVDTDMQPFQKKGEALIKEQLWPLELGSTVLFFYRQLNDWDLALNKACEFKNVSAEVGSSRQALELAKQFEKRD